MPKLADPKPPVCSVCLQPPMVREHQLRYVDFETAYEGPVITRYGERVDSGQTIPIPVDDLIICEECLRAGAAIIGLADDTGLVALIQEKDQMIQNLKREVADKDRAVADLNHTVTVAIDHPIKRPARAPKLTGPDEKAVRELKKRRAKAAKISKTMKEKADASR